VLGMAQMVVKPPATAAAAAAPRTQLRYDRAFQAGAYELELAMVDGTRQTTFFARSPEPAEGDLELGGQAALAAAFGSEQFSYVDRTAGGAGQDLGEQDRQEYWLWALAALAALLAAETFLGQRFGHYHLAGQDEAAAGPPV